MSRDDFWYRIGVIPGNRLRPEPVCWTWEPPSAAEREYARAGGWLGPPQDEEDIAFRLLVRWCRVRCAICGRSDARCPLVMDHDHRTGLCRGILCRDCNQIEGFGGGAAFDCYRARPPALICDAKVTYWPGSVPQASPDLEAFQSDIGHLAGVTTNPLLRHRKPWLPSELAIASRDDLTDEEVAKVLCREAKAVTSRRRTLPRILPDINEWL